MLRWINKKRYRFVKKRKYSTGRFIKKVNVYDLKEEFVKPRVKDKRFRELRMLYRRKNRKFKRNHAALYQIFPKFLNSHKWLLRKKKKKKKKTHGY